MNNEEYFKRAEKSNRRFRVVVVISLVIMVALLAAVTVVSFAITSNNHATSQTTLNTITENEVKLNQNLTNEIHCVLVAQRPLTNVEVDACFANSQDVISTQSK